MCEIAKKPGPLVLDPGDINFGWAGEGVIFPSSRGIAILGEWVDTSGVRVGATGLAVGSELARPPASPPACKVCWLGLEPQGTPNHTFLPPNG